METTKGSNKVGNPTSLLSLISGGNVMKLCSICGVTELNDEDDDICPDCKSIIANMNLEMDGFRLT